MGRRYIRDNLTDGTRELWDGNQRVYAISADAAERIRADQIKFRFTRPDPPYGHAAPYRIQSVEAIRMTRLKARRP